MTVPRAVRYAERELLIWRRIWYGNVFSGLAMPLMFLGAIGWGLGGLVDENTASVEGLDYLSFVAPGLLVVGAMQNNAGSALWGVIAGHKWLGGYNAAVTTPLRPSDVYVGNLLWWALWAAMMATPFMVIAAVLGGVASWWGVLAIPVAALCAVAFGAPLAAFSATQESDVAFSIILRLVILPLSLFSGTFFPLDNLPAVVRPVAWFTPLWHAAELARGATTGSIGLAAATVHLAVLAAFVGVGTAIGVRTFTRRLTP